MSIELVTGHKGENHITSEQIAAFNSAIVGNGGMILNYGSKCVLSNPSSGIIRIADGIVLFKGRQIVIDNYEDVQIPITSSTHEKYSVYISYTEDDGIESVSIETTLDDSTLTENDLKIAEITVENYAIKSYELLLQTSPNIEKITDVLTQLNSISTQLTSIQTQVNSNRELSAPYNRFFSDACLVDLNDPYANINKNGYVNGNSTNLPTVKHSNGTTMNIEYATRDVKFINVGQIIVTIEGRWKCTYSLSTGEVRTDGANASFENRYENGQWIGWRPNYQTEYFIKSIK